MINTWFFYKYKSITVSKNIGYSDLFIRTI